MPGSTEGAAKMQRLPNGRFQKGQAIKSPGRPKGTPNPQRIIELAVQSFQAAHQAQGLPCRCQPRCTSFDQHALNRALLNDSVLIALLNKRYPNAMEPPQADPRLPAPVPHTFIFHINGAPKAVTTEELLHGR